MLHARSTRVGPMFAVDACRVSKVLAAQMGSLHTKAPRWCSPALALPSQSQRVGACYSSSTAAFSRLARQQRPPSQYCGVGWAQAAAMHRKPVMVLSLSFMADISNGFFCSRLWYQKAEPRWYERRRHSQLVLHGRPR